MSDVTPSKSIILQCVRDPSGVMVEVRIPGENPRRLPRGTGALWAFSSLGRAFSLMPVDAPTFDMFGKAVERVWELPLADCETIVTTHIGASGEASGFFCCLTARGRINKTPCERFVDLRPGGVAAIHVDDGDALVAVHVTREDDLVWCATREGYVSTLSLNQVVPASRASNGFQALKLRVPGDRIVASGIACGDDFLWLFTSLGFAQRIDWREVPRGLLGRPGVKAVHVGKDNGQVVLGGLFPDGARVDWVTNAGRVVTVDLVSTIAEEGSPPEPKLKKKQKTSKGGTLSGRRLVTLSPEEVIVSADFRGEVLIGDLNSD